MAVQQEACENSQEGTRAYRLELHSYFTMCWIKKPMKNISKPHLVDLLRIFDQKRWIHPRIRYASVRSKGELLEDLGRHFRAFKAKDRVTLVPRKQRNLPKIEYDLKKRVFLLDGVAQDFPRESRQRPKFEIRRGPVTLTFGEWSSSPARRTRPVSSSVSPTRGTRAPADCSRRTEPFPHSE